MLSVMISIAATAQDETKEVSDSVTTVSATTQEEAGQSESTMVSDKVG